MLTFNPLYDLTLQATAVLPAKRFVTWAGAVPAAAALCAGVANHAAAIGDSTSVAIHGVAVVEAGAAVAQYAAVETDNAGRAITLAAGIKLGRALDAAAQAGDSIRVLLIPA